MPVQSEEYTELAQEVIQEKPDLEWLTKADVSIAFMRSDKEKKSKGKLVFGECILVNELYKSFCPYDFLIVIYEQNISELSRDQVKILLYHELLHVGVDEKNGQLKKRIVPHDIEDFRKIIDQYGIDWAVS